MMRSSRNLMDWAIPTPVLVARRKLPTFTYIIQFFSQKEKKLYEID